MFEKFVLDLYRFLIVEIAAAIKNDTFRQLMFVEHLISKTC